MPRTGTQTAHATYWESVADTRWGAYLTDIQRRAIMRAHELLETPSAALEVGADGGRWSHMLTDLGWEMTCTDVDPEGLDACRRRVPSAECILVSPSDSSLPCEPDSMDLLLCIEVPPVIHSDWFPHEAGRVLRPDGIVVGVFWNRRSLRGILANVKSRFKGTADYYRLPYGSWRKELQSSDYHFVHEEGCAWFPFGRSSNSALVPHFVRLEKWLGLRRLVSASPWVVFVARRTAQATALKDR